MKAVIDRFLRLHNGLWVRRKVRVYFFKTDKLCVYRQWTVFLPLVTSMEGCIGRLNLLCFLLTVWLQEETVEEVCCPEEASERDGAVHQNAV